jgi:hypothetical protein
MNLCHQLTLSFRRRKRAASNAPRTENEKQTVVRKDDALNPSQHAEVPGHEAEQSSNTGMADDSPSRCERPRGRQEDKTENEYLDKLMLMVGLENAKAHFFSIYASVQAAKRRDEDPHGVILDTVIVGNPGTGEPLISLLL